MNKETRPPGEYYDQLSPIDRQTKRAEELMQACNALGARVTHFPNHGFPVEFTPDQKAVFKRARPVVIPTISVIDKYF